MPNPLRVVAWIFAFLSSYSVSIAEAGKPILVDLSPDNQRRDVLAPDAIDWRIASAPTMQCESHRIRMTLRPINGATWASDWWKAGFDHPAALVSDGVVVTDGQPDAMLEMIVEGLSPGKHSILSYHNGLDDKPWPALRMEVLGQASSDWKSPTQKVIHDDDACTHYLQFEAKAGEAICIRWSLANTESKTARIILNGFCIDGGNLHRQARRPSPFDGDEHAEERPKLQWQSSGHVDRFDLYLGTEEEAVRNANVGSPEFVGSFSTNRWEGAPPSYLQDVQWNPFKTYYWRVDERPSETDPPHEAGRVWRFQVRRLAFEGAEGYGRFAKGGRGGKVFHVTHLGDAGPGSLRDAVESEGPRTVVFDVGGTIQLQSKLVVRNPYLTVAGQTAPGDGICIRGYTFGCFGTHDVILRHLRIRVGDEAQLTMDGTGFASTDHSIMDHCSVSWSIDEGVSSRGAGNITVQRCIVAEALNIANHKKYQPGKGHSFAGSISGNIGSFHHNLLAHCAGRNWSLAGGLNKGGGFAGKLDIRNNVVYNWEHRTNDGGVKALQLVNNFYIPGPATRVFHLLKPDVGSPADPQQYYVDGNVMEGRDYQDNWGSKCTLIDPAAWPAIRLMDPPWVSYVTETTAEQAYIDVLANVGANLPHHDAVDQRVLRDVRNRTASSKGSRSGVPGIIDSQTDVGGWPTLESGKPPIDTDRDGIPDAWEQSHGLDPRDPSDATRYDSTFITPLEHFLR